MFKPWPKIILNCYEACVCGEILCPWIYMGYTWAASRWNMEHTQPGSNLLHPCFAHFHAIFAHLHLLWPLPQELEVGATAQTTTMTMTKEYKLLIQFCFCFSVSHLFWAVKVATCSKDYLLHGNGGWSVTLDIFLGCFTGLICHVME